MNLIPVIANYITRYAPSERRIRKYLLKKKCINIDEILDQIHYNEGLMIQLWMKTFIALGKGKNEIQLKLQKKEFPKDLIGIVITEFDSEMSDWSNFRYTIENQISKLVSRGKSKQAIYQKLMIQYPYFRDEIHEIMDETSDTKSLEKEIEKYRLRYNLEDPLEKQKFYTAIVRKGFRFDDIKRIVLSKK